MAYGLMGNGGLPSDMVTSDIEGVRRLKVTSESPFNSAAADGLAFASASNITIPANSEVSLKVVANSHIVVRFVRAKGAFIEYHQGDVSGDLVELGTFFTMNANITNNFHASSEYRAGSPTGEIVITGYDEIGESFYKNGNMSVGLMNKSSQQITVDVSIGVEPVGELNSLNILISDTFIDANTEMSDYG